VPGTDILCRQQFAVDRASELAKHVVAASAGRRLYFHAMNCVVDWTTFALWEDGRLIRALSLDLDHGVIEDIGDRLAFELPYWEGTEPVGPLPFRPLVLGARALVEFFRFQR
jgi:hypothetical protein